MSQNQHEVIVKITDQASAGLKNIEIQTSKVKSSFEGIAGTLTKAFAGVAVGSMFVGLVNGVEQANIGFETLLGNHEKALQMMQDIDTFASKTPFEKTTLTPLVQQMIGMGIEAKNTLPTLQILGDSMAALGRSDADLQGVVLALGQIQTKGKVSAEELMQLAERGLPVYKILEDKLHLTKKQLGDIGNAGITSATGINALLTGLNERFGGNMAKMANTLKGQWSNLMDNLKSLVGNSGQILSNKVRDTLATINKWFDEHKAIVKKVAEDFFSYFSTAFSSVMRIAGVLLGAVTTILVSIFGETAKTTKGQAQIWSKLFMAISNGFIAIATVASIAIRGIAFTVSWLWQKIKVGAQSVAYIMAQPFLGWGQLIESVVNIAILGINKIREAIGMSQLEYVSYVKDMAGNLFDVMVESMAESDALIKEETSKLKDGVLEDIDAMVTGIQSNFEQFDKAIIDTGSNTSDLQDRINGAINDMGEFGNTAVDAGGKSSKASKEAKEQMKKLQEQAESAVKSIADGFDKTKKDIDEARAKLKTITEDWTKFRTEGIKALSDINREIQKFNTDTANIKLGFQNDQNEALAKRLLDIRSKLAELAKEGDPNGEQASLLEEQSYILGIVDQKILSQVESYSKLNEAQKIVQDNQKKMTEEMKKREEDLAVLTEKRAIINLQANQKSINDQKIRVQEENGIMKAFYEDSSGKMVEIKNQENVNLAVSIKEKQDELLKDYNATNEHLQKKLSLQKSHLEDLKVAYRQYHNNLTSETKTMSEQLISYYKSVSSSLREVIALRKEAGVSSPSSSGQSIGTRAFGGQVSKGEQYRVGENGEELFVPSTSGTIIPNDRLRSGATININMGGVVVRNDQDIDSLVGKVRDMLIRDTQLFKLGIG